MEGARGPLYKPIGGRGKASHFFFGYGRSKRGR